MLRTIYALATGVRCLIGGNGTAVLLPSKERLDGLSAPQLAALKSLNAGPLDLSGDADDVAALLDRLMAAGALTMMVADGDRELYSLKPFRRPPAKPGIARRLSKFTIIRRSGDQLIAENPRAWCDVSIAGPDVLALLGGLPSSLPDTVADRIWSDLSWAGHAADTEQHEFASRSWNPHELWFHRRSTVGDRGISWAHFGPTRWADGEFEPIPARSFAFDAANPIELPTPDLDRLRASDITLTAAVEERKSVRAFDDATPIDLAQLGELLYRCARTRSNRVLESTTAVPEELPSRPYPSGGSLYELELYPVVRNVAGLASGMYHYDSFQHALRLVAGYDDPAVQRLIAPAALTLSDGQLPQVLLSFGARVGRIMWTYEQMPYAVILKHVGVLTQTLYLTATAMGLGGVAQGYGDTAAFAAATGIDELVECNVGSFVVGTPAG